LYDEGEDQMTLKDLRVSFKDKFGTQAHMLSQLWGIIRLIPLMLIKEDYKKKKLKSQGDVMTIRIIRDSFAHNTFSFSKNGYLFKSDKGKRFFSYSNFSKFLHKIENKYYKP